MKPMRLCFLVDGRTGLTPQDKIIADRLRQSPRPVYLAVNKGEGGNRAVLPPSSTNLLWAILM